MHSHPGQGLRWIHILAPRAAARVQLVCFAHAGAGASTYRQWARALPEHIEVVAVQLPGREGRFREAPFNRLAPLAASFMPDLHRILRVPFLVFGHSFGAALANRLVREFPAAGIPPPAGMMFSGAGPPAYAARDAAPLSDEALLGHLRDLGGTPPEILGNERIMQMYLPALRADLQLMRSGDLDATAPLDIPFTTFAGADDRSAPPDRVRNWDALSRHPGRHHVFPGGHFFIHDAGSGAFAVLSRLCEAQAGI